ncbi:MAG TPA: LysE family translocator, partial [Ramlibacter sp.]|nr:LysE family translocator [Ramlibacter sp.]
AGVGLLLAVLPGLFHAVLLAGALYVAWMGIGLWRSPATLAGVPEGASRPRSQTFLRAAATCLMNPKAYLFMVAVFPQFVRPERGSLAEQVAVMGVIIAGAQAVVYGAVALAAGGVRERLAGSVRAQAIVARAVAALLVLTAAWALWQGWAGAR